MIYFFLKIINFRINPFTSPCAGAPALSEAKGLTKNLLINFLLIVAKLTKKIMFISNKYTI